MKKILYLTFYYKPDLCAGSFRNSPLIDELVNQGKDRVHIEVLTTVPNRYHTFNAEASEQEVHPSLTVRRILIPKHKSGFIDQISSFRAYYSSVSKLVKGKEYDLVVASSSRLFTAYLGYRVAHKLKVPLYLDIRDIFVDTLDDVLSNKLLKGAALPILKQVERKTFGYASHINLISGGFKEYFKAYKQCEYSFFSNGIDDEFYTSGDISRFISKQINHPKIVLYAGNLGEGQGLHKIIPNAAEGLSDTHVFRIIGDGGTRKRLEEEIKVRGLKNVELFNPMPRRELMKHYDEADYFLIHLNDYDAFKKVLPSKVFELSAYPQPLLAGVAGFAGKFIQDHVPNSIVFQPCDAGALIKHLQNDIYELTDREEFKKKFSRNHINAAMAKSILDLLNTSSN